MYTIVYIANDFVPVSFHLDFNSLPAIGGDLVNCVLQIPRIRLMIFWVNLSDLNFNMYIEHEAERHMNTCRIARSDWRTNARKYQQSNLVDSPTSNYHSVTFGNLRWQIDKNVSRFLEI